MRMRPSRRTPPGQRSGSRDALLRPGPLRTVRATLTAHGSSKPVRVGRFVVIRRCDGPRSVHRRSGVQLVLGFHASPTSPSGSPDPVSTLASRVRAPACIRPVIPPTAPVEADAMLSSVSCRLSAHRHSLLGHPVPLRVSLSLRSDYGCVHTHPDLNGVSTSARASCDRGGCPLYPEDHGALPTEDGARPPVCRFTAASPWTPLQLPIGGASRNEGIIEGSLRSPVRSSPSPVAAGWNSSPWALSPELRTPPLPATHVRLGTGHRTLTWATSSTSSTSNRCIHSTRATSCRTHHRDFAHGVLRAVPPTTTRRLWGGRKPLLQRPRSARRPSLRSGVTVALMAGRGGGL
jgi:hypothetical protein